MKCPRCAHENRPSARFCEDCANRLNVDATKVPYAGLTTEVERLTQALTESLEQQIAIAELLRIIKTSPTELQPVLDVVVKSAVRFCGADDAIILRCDGQNLQAVAHTGPIPVDFDLPVPCVQGTVGGRSVLERRPVHVADLQAESDEFPEGSAFATRFGARTTLGVPLMRDETAIGTIQLRRTDVDPFTDKQVDLLKTFADQAVIAIENVRLFKELQARNGDLTEALEQQTATSEILRVISSSPSDIHPIFTAIASTAVRLCGARIATVFRYDGELIHLIAHHGYTAEALELRRGLFPGPPHAGSVTGRAILNRDVVHVPDVLADGRYPYRNFARAADVRSVVAVPMLRDKRPVGVITVSRAEPGAFAERHIEVLKTFADQAVIAVETVRLVTELETRNRELTETLAQQAGTGDVLRIISTSPTEPQPVLEAVIKIAAQLCGAYDAAVFQVDGESLRVAAHQGPLHGAIGLLLPVARGTVAGRSVLERRAVHVADLPTEAKEFPEGSAFARQLGYRTTLTVPLLRQGTAVGAIQLRRAEMNPFTDRQVALLQTFADQAVIAIENARLFREVEEKSRELEAVSRRMEQLYRLSTAMQEPLSLREQLARVLETATRIGLLDRIYVWAVSREGDTLVNLAAAGFAEDESKQFERFAIPLVEAGAMYRSLRDGRAVLFDEANPLPPELYLKPQYLLKGLRTSRFLVIPMIARGETVGVFAGDNKPSGRPIGRETVELLQTFASHGAVAIANARLFQTIEEKSRELEIASRHKSEFLANMSHELRTPLNAIIGFSEVLGERMFGELNEKQEEYLKDIHASGQHLLSLINDILDLSKIEAGRMELELSDFDLPMTIDNALMLVRERAARRSIALHSTVDERVSQIQGDERKIRQVLLNLLSNAIKFTPEGGRIEVGAKSVNASIEVSVTDTGVGIAPEDQEPVFEEFRQVGTADKKVEGTGLGLALSRKFIELHGGRIWVKSQVGAGSTFTFTVPVRRGE
jgi:signal transduction histidine kinase/putative methionine-R-sulfoxide reductase with GAF domain